MPTEIRRRVLVIGGRLVLAAVVPLLLTACPGPDVARDTNDGTAPQLSLSASGLPGTTGLVDVALGTPVTMGRGGTVVLVATARDDDGVGAVELWMTEATVCNGTMTGPGAAGAPAARTVGTVTATQAPSSLSTTFNLDGSFRPGCEVRYEVWVEADNVATTPVSARSATTNITRPGP